MRRQARSILIDPYANAFNDGPTGSEWAKDLTDMKPELHERKWEIDSLCYPVRLAHGYWRATGDTSVFDSAWRAAAAAILRTLREQQRKDGPGPYSFRRVTSVAYDTCPLGGYGNPTRKVGLIHSAFRPSDDACVFPLTGHPPMEVEGWRRVFEIAPGDLRQYVNQDQPDVFQPRASALPAGPLLKWRFPAGSVTAIELDTKL